MDELDHEKRLCEAIRNELDELLAIDPKSLVRREELGEESNFEEALPIFIRYHYCPVKSRIESVGWGHRVSFRGSRTAARPVKWAFSRKG